jgi:hypothetical protein
VPSTVPGSASRRDSGRTTAERHGDPAGTAWTHGPVHRHPGEALGGRTLPLLGAGPRRHDRDVGAQLDRVVPGRQRRQVDVRDAAGRGDDGLGRGAAHRGAPGRALGRRGGRRDDPDADHGRRLADRADQQTRLARLPRRRDPGQDEGRGRCGLGRLAVAAQRDEPCQRGPCAGHRDGAHPGEDVGQHGVLVRCQSVHGHLRLLAGADEDAGRGGRDQAARGAAEADVDDGARSPRGWRAAAAAPGRRPSRPAAPTTTPRYGRTRRPAGRGRRRYGRPAR